MRSQQAWESTFSRTPATEEQLQATEQTLGLSLPLLLNNLYTQIANGGFGPGYGLRGALGGYTADETMVDQYLSLVSASLNWKEQGLLEFSSDAWPNDLLPICPMGCGVEIALSPTGKVYRVGPAHKDLHYVAYAVFPSLEDWLANWLASESLRSSFSAY